MIKMKNELLEQYLREAYKTRKIGAAAKPKKLSPDEEKADRKASALAYRNLKPSTSFDEPDEEEAKAKLDMLHSFDEPAKTKPVATSGDVGSTSILQTGQKGQGPTSPEREFDFGVSKSYAPKPAGPEPTTKPKFRGQYNGQVAKLGKQERDKKASWIDRKVSPPEQKFGRVKSMEDTNVWVWDADAEEWIKPDAFDLRMKMKKNNESFEHIFEERCLTIK